MTFLRYCLATLPFCVVAIAGADEVDFATDIRPLLNEHCVSCHGGVKQAADLSFIHRDAALAVIEPGDPDDSILIDRIMSTDEDEVMPPPEHGHPLSSDQIELVRRWIAEGANWQQPWSYETPVHYELPKVTNESWCRNPIDRFVLARLEKEGIAPAADAPPQEWLRRVTLDLTGVPPTPEQLETFLANVDRDGEAAFAAKVDDLLRDTGFGHRWASVWLDQIRYADSRGLGLDGRREIWKYRDWVIAAINDDMPYDEFTIKQIAGDLLEHPTVDDRVATAANRLTQTNEEGGTDDEEFRIAAVIDRVSTVWQTWQGITFGCVQCHSHPYDPINHDEFYKFAAFFNNTADCDLNDDWPLLAVPKNHDDVGRASELDQRISVLSDSIWQREFDLVEGDESNWVELTDFTADANKQSKVKVEVRDGHTEFATIDTLSFGTVISIDAAIPNPTDKIAAIHLTILPRNPETAKADSEWGFMLSHFTATVVTPDGTETPIEFTRVIGDEPEPMKDPQASLNAKSQDGFAAYTRIHHARRVTFVAKEPVEVADGSRLKLVLDNQAETLGAFPLVTRRGRVAISSQPIFIAALNDEALVNDRRELGQLKSDRKQIPSSRTPVMVELPESLRRPTHVFIRGLFLTKGDEVTAAVPVALGSLPDDVPADRMALARWLVSPDNPLTARVAVNRVWAQLFGIGLVATEEDFGSSGERPSHPELLDELAIEFSTTQSYRLKRLIRSIVLSSVYRQSAAVRRDLETTDLETTDPENRLLARGPRFRMPAEMVRDQALAVSGLLNDQFGGPPVHPPIPDGIWKPFQASDKWDTAEPGDSNRYRRSIYTYTKRSIPFPMTAAFDAPSREFCNPRRLRSNTPIQALMTLNDITFVECAAALAERMNEHGQTLDEKLRYGFVAVATRQPDDAEAYALASLYFESVRAGEEPADAMAAVASVLLNLDEIMSK